MNDFKQGEMIEVRGHSSEKWQPRVFALTYNGVIFCESRAMPLRGLYPWEHAQRISNRQIAHYDIDTFPKGAVWVRYINSKERRLVISVRTEFVQMGSLSPGYSYAEIALKMELSTDGGETWEPASRLVE